jgi:hypothetical protein
MYHNVTKNGNSITLETELNPGIIKDCEKYLLSNPNASFYHHPLYLKILSVETGQQFVLIVSRNSSGEINGIISLLRTKGFPLNSQALLSAKRLSCLPRTPYSGPLADDRSILTSLLEHASRLGAEN